MRFALLALWLVGGVNASADVRAEMIEMIEGLPMRETSKGNPTFSFTNDDVFWAGKDQFANQPNFMGSRVDIKNLVTATSADGKTAWFAADVKGVPGDECAPEPCRPNRDPALHVTGLVEKTSKGWAWVAWHVAPPLTVKDQATLAKQKTLPDALPRATKGADDVAKLVESALADPTTFSALVSDRKDVVMYGSAGPERYVGGAKVKKQLAAWNLRLVVRDGVQAGSVGTNVVWLAANVDATSLKKKTATAEPYRMLLVLEKSGTVWKIVQLHFSVDIFTFQKR